MSSRALLLVERNFTAYRRAWLIIASGFFEPVFYLLSIGVGGPGAARGPAPPPRRAHTPLL
jgi:lipooligosaccharide transport system permease protein